jgi:hypothetical protein
MSAATTTWIHGSWVAEVLRSCLCNSGWRIHEWAGLRYPFLSPARLTKGNVLAAAAASAGHFLILTYFLNLF